MTRSPALHHARIVQDLPHLRRRRTGRRALLSAVHARSCRSARHGDYFAFLGVPRKLNLDAADLEQRFRALSRQFHPDYFYNATPAERRASLERSSYLNDAYRTLKQPITRIEYLLELEGVLTRRRSRRRQRLEAGAAGAARGSVRAERGARRGPRAARGRRTGSRVARPAAARAPADRRQARTSTNAQLQALSATVGRAGRSTAAARRPPRRCSTRCASACSSATTSTTCWRASRRELATRNAETPGSRSLESALRSSASSDA